MCGDSSYRGQTERLTSQRKSQVKIKMLGTNYEYVSQVELHHLWCRILVGAQIFRFIWPGYLWK